MKSYNRSISIPNILTVLRILLTPLFVIFLVKDMFPMALLVFAAAGLSDGLDGFIARYFNQRTALGAYLDPLADKLLLVSAFISLGVLNILPAWFTVIVIARDVIILLGIAVINLTEKKYEVKPTIVSKCTTSVQLLMVMLTLFDPGEVMLGPLHDPLMWIVTALTIASGLHYVYLGMNILQGPNNSGHP